MYVYLKLSTAVVMCLCLSACGGGSGGETVTVPTITPTSSPTPVTTPTPLPLSGEHLSAGDATVVNQTANAFSSRSANVTEPSLILKFNRGDDFFENPWVAGSASTSLRDGLGALFNNNACQDCHVRDGRGHAPNVSASEDGTDFSSLLIKASKTQVTALEAGQISQSLIPNVGDTSVGRQIQHDAIRDVKPEARLQLSYEPVNIVFADGFRVELRKPIWHLTSLYADEGFDFNPDTVFSPRVAPPMIGLGLLSLIDESTLLEKQDIDDADGDGISGKANFVLSEDSQSVAFGRFGWRAGKASLVDQVAGAFINDMGLTSRLHQEENCQQHQLDCFNADNGNGHSTTSYPYEVEDGVLDAVAFYSSHLGVPQRRNAYDEQVQRGKALFMEMGCEACHTRRYATEESDTLPELSNQVIFPYTDLLLHDMGAELADFTLDNQAATNDVPVEFLATAHEWRTPPLWGLGLAKTVDPKATFLHDGRARTVLEAVLWHAGEAEASKQQVLQLNAQQRDDLLSFLNDL